MLCNTFKAHFVDNIAHPIHIPNYLYLTPYGKRIWNANMPLIILYFWNKANLFRAGIFRACTLNIYNKQMQIKIFQGDGSV